MLGFFVKEASMRVFRSPAVAHMSLALALTVCAGAFAPSGALAQQQTPARQTIAQRFLANPGQTLQQYPDGGTAMVSLLREVAIADPDSLAPILALIPTANKVQKEAIGKALGQAAQVVVKTNQTYANKILQAIAETKDQDVFLAYSGGANDTGTAATGGGGGGGAGGAGAGGASGGQTNALAGTPSSTGAAQGIGGGSTPTGAFSYTSSVSGGGGTTGTTGTTAFTISTTTSP
jgi:hypothetical protein